MYANHICIAIEATTASIRAVQYKEPQRLLARSTQRGTVHSEP
jgi:hypothetical protein